MMLSKKKSFSIIWVKETGQKGEKTKNPPAFVGGWAYVCKGNKLISYS